MDNLRDLMNLMDNLEAKASVIKTQQEKEKEGSLLEAMRRVEDIFDDFNRWN